MNKIHKAVSVLLVIFIFAACASRLGHGAIDMLFSSKYQNIKRGIISTYQMGEAAIPELIDRIADSRPDGIDLESPMSSLLEGPRPRGLVAAYFVEWILAIDQIDQDDIMNSLYLLGNDLRSYIYQQAYILKDDKKISPGVLIAVKKAYEEWWERNSSKGLDELRREWKQGERPLSGTAFKWY
jgi:hypothetical protein